MDHRRCSVLCALLLVGLLCGQEEDMDIARAVRDLGAESFQVRKQAREKLAKLGWRAEAELEKAAKNADPEVAETARRLLAALLPGVRWDTPRIQRELVEQYVNAKDAGGAERLLRSLVKARPFPSDLLQGLVNWEPDATRRDTLAKLAWRELPALHDQLISAQDTQLYGDVLSWAARAGMVDAIPRIAAYALHQGRLDETRKRVAAQVAAEPTPFSRRLLAELHLLAGHGDEAVAAARELADWPYLEQVLVRVGAWSALAKELGERWETPSELQRVQLAAAQRLAGQEKLGLAMLGNVMAYDDKGVGLRLAEAAGGTGWLSGSQDLLQRQGLERHFAPAGKPTHGELFVHGGKEDGSHRREKVSAARCLLAHGFTADAIQVLVNEGNLLDAAKILHYRRQYEQADELMAAAVRDAKPPEKWFLAVKRAGMLWRRGDNTAAKHVQDLLENYRTGELEGMDDEAFQRLIMTMRVAGFRQQAAAALPGLLDRFAGKDAVVKGLVGSLHPGTRDVKYWWDCLRTADPEQALSARAKRLQDFLDGHLSPDETQQILRLGLCPDKPPKWRVPGLLAVARTSAQLGRQREAESAYALALRYATETKNQNQVRQVRATALGVFGPVLNWQALAAADMGQATNGNLGSLVRGANYLAWGGDREAGRKLAERALALTHAGSVDFVKEPLLDGGWGVSTRLLPLVVASSGYPDWASLWVARSAKNYAEQLRLQQRRWYQALCFPANQYYFETGMVMMNAEVAYCEAQVMVTEGKVATGLAKAQQAVAMCPEHEWRLIGVVAQLEKVGAKAEADKLAGHALAMEQRVLARFPDARDALFGVACISGWTKLQVDRGEACARRAIKREPDQTIFFEALAVLLHRSGDVVQGLELMRKCVRMDPSRRHLARLGWWLEQQRKK